MDYVIKYGKMINTSKYLYQIIILICILLSGISCNKEVDQHVQAFSKHTYNVDLKQLADLAIEDILDSVKTIKIVSKEPILLTSFAGHNLKGGHEFLFFCPRNQNAIYCINKLNGHFQWVVDINKCSPNFPQSFFDYAIRTDIKEIYIWDYYKNLFYVYNFSGQHLRNVIPENLPEKHYFDYYNTLNDRGIIFRLQGIPDRNDVFSNDYKNNLFAYYSFDNNQFSKLITIPVGSPKRNAMMSRYFYNGLNGMLYYFYYMGSTVYRFKPGSIEAFIKLKGEVFPDSSMLAKVDHMNRVNPSIDDEEFIQNIHLSKITSIYAVLDRDNYYLILAGANQKLYYFILSKNDNLSAKFETKFDGFEKMENYGCFKERPLYQMADGRVFSISDGYFMNDSDLECNAPGIINQPIGDSISNEDLFITEYYFKNEIDLNL